MNEPLGEFGGVVTRKVKLFGESYPLDAQLSPELLGKISLRHRRALASAGLLRYHSGAEGAAAGFDVTATETKTAKKKAKPTKTKRGARSKKT